jgi:hypothetical protein
MTPNSKILGSMETENLKKIRLPKVKKDSLIQVRVPLALKQRFEEILTIEKRKPSDSIREFCEFVTEAGSVPFERCPETKKVRTKSPS